MGILDWLQGKDKITPGRPAEAPAQSADEQAIARYRYLLRTAPPEAIEQAHAEAFAQLTPEQRRQLLQTLNENAPASEKAAGQSADPQALARMATRAEIRQPGAMERMLGGRGGPGIGLGGMMAGSLLGSIAGTVLGSAIAHQFFADDAGTAGAAATGDENRDGFSNAEHTPGDSSDFDDSSGDDGGFGDGGFDEV